MKMRISCVWMCLFLCLSMLTGCKCREDKEMKFRIAIASDLHYYAPNLTDYGELFQQVMQAGDGKVTEYCDQITDAFLEEVKKLQPEALILTGDLSFNGERESHETLAQKLAELEKCGIPVYVLPGNHDLFRSGTYSFFGSEAETVEAASDKDFRDIYSAFGFEEAISEDSDSLSYSIRLNETARILMLDANTLHDFCGFSDVTLAWIEDQLADAEAAGDFVLAACHQNLFQHSMFSAGYAVNKSEKLQALLMKYHVPLFLSGHMHIQHIRTEGTITEIAASALTMGACQYGILEATGDSFSYEARPVDVAAWSEDQGLPDEPFLSFSTYALSRMEDRMRLQAKQHLTASGYSEEEIRELSDYACALNTAYFSGDLSKVTALDPEGKLLQEWKESGTFLGVYFASIENDIGKDYTHWFGHS